MLNTSVCHGTILKAWCVYTEAKSGNLSSSLPAYLDSHDNTARHMFHLVHHSVCSPAQLCNLLQVIGLHHKVLDRRGRCYIHVFIQLSKMRARPHLSGKHRQHYLISDCDASFRVKISRGPAGRKQCGLKLVLKTITIQVNHTRTHSLWCL